MYSGRFGILADTFTMDNGSCIYSRTMVFKLYSYRNVADMGGTCWHFEVKKVGNYFIYTDFYRHTHNLIQAQCYVELHISYHSTYCDLDKLLLLQNIQIDDKQLQPTKYC